MPNNKRSSQRIAQLASETLRKPDASAIAKSLAGSAMAQANTGKRTGAEMEDKAARVLNSEKYSDTTKALAGSVLAQSEKKR